VRDAELVDAVEGIGDAARMPSDAKEAELRSTGRVSLIPRDTGAVQIEALDIRVESRR
jgi:hypothetical protein